MKSDQTDQILQLFAARVRLTLTHPEKNVYQLDRYNLYLPGYNSFFDETITSFQVDRTVTIPGVRSMPNGDPGYPDDFDIQKVGEFDTLIQALQKIGTCIVEDWIDEVPWLEIEDAYD
jgi:hypothetical protein